MIKLKTQWWHNTRVQRYTQCQSEEQRAQEEVRRCRKLKYFQVQELRAVVKGWPRNWSQGLLCEWGQVQQVKCFQARCGWRQGAIIVSFGSARDTIVMEAEIQTRRVE